MNACGPPSRASSLLKARLGLIAAAGRIGISWSLVQSTRATTILTHDVIATSWIWRDARRRQSGVVFYVL